MLVFVLALQSPAASKDWHRVSQLCERTLRSICGQTSPNFRVFLVCNRKPETDFTHPALTIIERDLPTPDATSAARMQDKWTKLKIGLIAARHLAPAHVMIMDADDCVHKSLARHVELHPGVNGWSMTSGYLWDDGSRLLYQSNNFNRLCGSSAIVRLSPEEFPSCETDDHSAFFILSNGHSTISDYLSKQGKPLRPLPFIGSVYVTATGENDSAITMGGWQGRKRALQKMVSARPLVQRLRREFGLYKTSHGGKTLSLWTRVICYFDALLEINNRCKICKRDIREINRCGTCGEGLEDWPPFKPITES